MKVLKQTFWAPVITTFQGNQFIDEAHISTVKRDSKASFFEGLSPEQIKAATYVKFVKVVIKQEWHEHNDIAKIYLAGVRKGLKIAQASKTTLESTETK